MIWVNKGEAPPPSFNCITAITKLYLVYNLMAYRRRRVKFSAYMVLKLY